MGTGSGQARTVRIVISGYYGFRNSGDEAVLQAILLALREQGEQYGVDFQPVVLSVDPAWTTRMYGVEAVHRMRLSSVLQALRASDGLISGGGSLLQDATGPTTIPYYLGIIKLAQWLGKPVFVYSQGIGPVGRKLFHPFIRSVFRRCRYVSVRDEESAALLQRMGLREPAEVVPDPVMGLPLRGQMDKPVAIRRDKRSVIGISVRFWTEDRSELQGLAEALQAIRAAQPVELRFLPFHQPADGQASQEVIARLGEPVDPLIRIVEGAEHPQEMLARVSECDLLIGMRLHSLIYAASQMVPMIGITYDPKIDQFLHRLGMEPAAATGHFDAGRVAAEALRLLVEPAAWAAEKRERIEALKRDAQRPAARMAQFYTGKG